MELTLRLSYNKNLQRHINAGDLVKSYPETDASLYLFRGLLSLLPWASHFHVRAGSSAQLFGAPTLNFFLDKHTLLLS